MVIQYQAKRVNKISSRLLILIPIDLVRMLMHEEGINENRRETE
jgi:hypothetical protein